MAMQITDANYEALKAEGKPMILDFSATWCGPCQLIAPMIDTLAEEYNGKIIVGKIDVDENPELSGAFSVRNVPSVFFMKDGEVQKKLLGAQTMATLKEEAEKLL